MAADIYTVVVADHFHYQDASEHWTAGTYATPAAALSRARDVVADSVVNLARDGTRGEELLRRYLSTGDDPFIVGDPAVEWSALACAKECIASIDELLQTHGSEDRHPF